MRARTIMVLGTSSHVGKSLLTAALCRILSDHGVRVAPFKSQNMSLNSAATAEGLEIGRAQALQAEAARTPASVHMNPILLKPSGDMSSQVVVRGKVWGQVSAADYHLRRVEELMPAVRESYETLAAQYEVIVLEGAGSPAEINLKQHDIVNMRMAELAEARCILVGDIDRGGVFAALLGTVELLEPEEQARIAGFVINKFRGDRTLLEPGIDMMVQRLGKPCLGVVPYLHGLALEEEDSLSLAEQRNRPAWTATSERALRIAVVALPSFSNFTDFDALRSEPSVALRFTREADDIRQADLVILPGSKQTASDLRWLRAHDLDQEIVRYAQHGLIAGICGGMQMLGEFIFDPLGIEDKGRVDGLALLDLHTSMKQHKVTTLTSGTLCLPRLFGQPIGPLVIAGYEIHLGETIYGARAQPFARIERHVAGHAPSDHLDGCASASGRIFGTYLHGLFDDDQFRHALLVAARAFHHLSPIQEFRHWKERREASFDQLAAEVSRSLDLPRIFGWLGIPFEPDEKDPRPAPEEYATTTVTYREAAY